MRNAVFSVSDKTNILPFAQTAAQNGFRILSTGGSAAVLREGGLKVTDISDYTGFPEMMDGRVKTLHPKIHGGLLSLRDNSRHKEEAQTNGIEMVDLICVNLYPFEKTTADPNCSIENAIENIDIGGPSMLRSAAKNYRSVTVVADPADYKIVMQELEENGDTSLATRERLAVKVFKLTSEYDRAVSAWLDEKLHGKLSRTLVYENGKKLRYGENPHQEGIIYYPKNSLHSSSINVPAGKLLHGKEMSYNNYIDADAGFSAVRGLYPAKAVSVIKHSNPCGLATGETLREAIEKAWEGDIVSAFGSVISSTAEFDLQSAEFLQGKFVEVITAPSFTTEAYQFLTNKSKGIRLIETGPLPDNLGASVTYRVIDGALLEQTGDNKLIDSLICKTKKNFSPDDREFYEFAYRNAKHTKSNAVTISYAYKPGCYMILGMGAGQPNRIDSTRKLAASKARENIIRLFGEEHLKSIMGEAILASDAFFPFADNIEEAAAVGIKKIIQPGGSKRDQEVIEMCDKHDITMVFAGLRHFHH